MKTLTTTFVLAAALSAVHAQADDYILSYDSTNGSLTIKAPGNLSVYAIVGNGDVFDKNQHTPFIPNAVFDSQTSDLGEALIGNGVGPGNYSLGNNLMEPGLDLQGFEAAIDSTYYTPGAGNFSGVFVLEVVPEPASLALLGLGGLLIGRRRR